MKINFEDAISLLENYDDDAYRDYSQESEGGVIIGGDVGRDEIIKNLFEYKDSLFITDKGFHNLYGFLCLGISYVAKYPDGRTPRIYIPVDVYKFNEYLKRLNK